ncbi:MAG: hypothetical protein AAGB32_03490 [Pseudomonadota bacterium]
MKYLTILFAGLLFLLPLSAQAQIGKKASSEEDIAIAFYKTGGIQPDLKSWVEESEIYRTTPLARRDEMMQRELQRLASKYSTFDPKDDVIVVQTKAKIKHVEEIDPVEKTSSYFAEITFARGPDAHCRAHPAVICMFNHGWNTRAPGRRIRESKFPGP